MAGTTQTPIQIVTAPAGAASQVTSLLHDAFTLGWEIEELKSRILVALQEPVYSGLRLASVWRAGFSRIAGLQVKVFPTSADARTLYAPPPPDALPYLYPPEPDYASVGISGTDGSGAAILGNFALHEVTRRAINCLSLLYVRTEESLVPADVVEYQDRLIAEVLRAARDPESGGGTDEVMPDGEPAAGSPSSPAMAPTDEPGDRAARLEQARKILTERTVKFLEAWDGYLRENYYVGGGMPNDNLELIAYEAGHAMCSLSWGISVRTVELEQQRDSGVDLSQQFVEAWKTVFRDQDVIRLQHKISALSTALDDAYYLQHPEKRRPADDGVLVKPDPDLPSYAIRAVKNSINYWHRAVRWIPEHPQRLRKSVAASPADWSPRMRVALTEQADVWQTLMTGQQSLRAFNMESATHKIMQDVMDEIQESVRRDFGSGIRQGQQALQDLTKEAKAAMEVTARIAAEGLDDLVSRTARTFWPVLAVAAVVGVVLIVLALLPAGGAGTTADAVSGGTGLTALISAAMGYLGLGKVKEERTKKQDEIGHRQAEMTAKLGSQPALDPAPAALSAGQLLSRVQGAAQETGTLLVQAFERGYEQIRVELDGLNRSVGVSYPLVEFFGLTFDLQSDVAFLTDIIWDGTEREAELKRVMRAAFGPLSLFISSVAAVGVAGDRRGGTRGA